MFLSKIFCLVGKFQLVLECQAKMTRKKINISFFQFSEKFDLKKAMIDMQLISGHTDRKAKTILGHTDR